MTALEGSIAVIHDMPEEGWPSMDQMGHLLTSRLPALAPGLTVTPVRHRMTRVFSPGPLKRVRPLFSADRALNRMVLYPRKLKRTAAAQFDIYHIVDHSYAQLALELPAGPHDRQLPRHRHLPQPGAAGPGSTRSALQPDDAANRGRPAAGGADRLRQPGRARRPGALQAGRSEPAAGGSERHRSRVAR